MSCLLDTHVFLWSLFAPERLSRNAAHSLLKQETTVYVSSVSFWEISLKYALGKLELVNVLPDELPRAAIESGFEIREVTADEMASFYRLPKLTHKDPFDRLIVWQAISGNLRLMTADRGLADYRAHGLKLLW